MATAGDLVRAGLRIPGIVGVGRAATAEEMQDGLSALIDMLAAWELEGVRLGPLVGVALTNTTTIPLPASHLRALKYNLAAELADEYGSQLRPKQIEIAATGLQALQAAYAFVPDTVPEPGLGTSRPVYGAYDV